MLKVNRIISLVVSMVMLLGCFSRISVVSANTEASSVIYYLTTANRISGSGTVDQTNSSLGGTPQIRISAGTTAEIIVKAKSLSGMHSAKVSYAQNGGTLDIKLTALETASSESGTELLSTQLTDIAAHYDTRQTGNFTLTGQANEEMQYLKVELSCDGSRDNNSYIDYVELIGVVTEDEQTPTLPPIAPDENGMPGEYAAYYSFDGNYENAVANAEHIKSDATGIIDATTVDATAPKDSIVEDMELKYSDAHSKSGKSINLIDGDKGVALDYMMPKNTSYTVSYWAKATRAQDKNGRQQMKNPTILFDASNYEEQTYNYLYSSVYSTYNEFIIRDGSDEQYGHLFGKEKTGYNTWQMYTYTYDAETGIMYIYINGNLVEQVENNTYGRVNTLDDDAYLYVGVNPWSKIDGTFAGYVDELYIYERVLTASEVNSAYSVLKDKGEGTNNVRSTVFIPTIDDSYRSGVVYGRGIELQYQRNEADNGKLIATSEYYSGTRMDGDEYFPIFVSEDEGASWNEISGVYDTENNVAKFYPDAEGQYRVEGEVDGEGAKKAYGASKWSMRHQPHLYELPEDWTGANLEAGTVLCAGLTASVDTTATDPANDFDGNLNTRIDIYYSTDACKTWTFLGHVADGGESRVDWGDAIWEPNLILENDKLYCFYSDERGFYENTPHVQAPEDDDTAQIIVAQGSSDGKTWDEPFDVVNYHEENNKFRPGMPVVTKLATGEFVVAYEGMAMGDPITYTYYKISNGADIESWNATATDLNVPGCNRGSPYCCTLPTGEIVFGAYGSENVFVNSDNLATNTFTQYATGVITGYSRSLFPMKDGRLFVVSGGRSYPNYMQTLEAGVIDIGLCSDRDEGLRVGTEIPQRNAIAQRKQGIRILYPQIVNGKVQFQINQYIDESYETVKVRVTNKTAGTVYEDEVTMRETAQGTRFNGSRLNAQTVSTELEASDITACVIDIYDTKGNFLVTTNESGLPEEKPDITSTPTPGVESEDPVVHITFDEEGIGTGSYTAKIGGTITENGTVEYIKTENGTNALSIATNSADNYLELPRGVLNNAKAATVSMWVKSTSRGWPFMSTTIVDGSQPNKNEKYLGIISETAAFTAQRYNNSGVRNGSFTSEGDYTDWKNLTVVYEQSSAKIYVDGKLVAVDNSTIDIASLMTADARTWIGHANWGNGEGFSGMIDDFKIYNRALSKSEIKDIAYANTGNLDAAEIETEAISISKSENGNPIVNLDADGNRIYAGDPAAVVIGDTVYLVVGHDVPGKGTYNMPEWLYYTSKDMQNWNYGGKVLGTSENDIPWRNSPNNAYASQLTPYTNKITGETKYYFYFCTTDNKYPSRSLFSIGVAVADNPEGPYISTNSPMIDGTVTAAGDGHGWQDIDPTIWIDTDENGEEHRYLMWGNVNCFICELNEDMISVKDMNGDGEITYGEDIKEVTFSNTQANQEFTEAPWLYRRQDENGNYYGKYYMFAAWGWTEKMGYATADNPWGPWTFESIIMENTLTSNTNHPSVIDFNNKTYFIYHNGSLPGGSGGTRSICVQELKFNEDGSVNKLEESSIGLCGTASAIQTRDGKYLGHNQFDNPQDAEEGTYTFDVKVYDAKDGTNTKLEIIPARYVPENMNADNYVSIQAANKEGHFIKSNENLYLGDVSTKFASDKLGTMGAKMSYKTVKALDGTDGVSFESVEYPGKFLSVVDGIILTIAPTQEQYESCSFNVSEYEDGLTPTPKPTVSNVKFENGNISFTINNAEDYETVTVYVAEYNENSTLAAVKVKEVEVKDIEQAVSMPYEKISSDNATKIMIWQEMKPITDAVVVQEISAPTGYAAYYSFDDSYDGIIGESGHTTENVGVMSISKSGYGGNSIYGGTSPRNVASKENVGILYSTETRNNRGKSLQLDAAHGVALSSYIPKDTSFTVSYWTKYTSDPIGNLNGNPVVLLDGSDYSTTTNNYHDLNYIQGISGAYTKTGFYVKGVTPRTDKNSDVSVTGRFQLNSDEWVLNTFTFNAETNQIRTYQNGEASDRPDSILTIQDIPNDMYITLGADQWGRGYTGLIDDMYIYERMLSDEEIASLYDKDMQEGYDQSSNTRLINKVTIPYKELAQTGEIYRCGVNYARAIQLQQEGAFKGRCYLTSEFYPDGRWDHHEYFPIWESVDYGESWILVGKVEDTEHNKKQYVKDADGNFSIKATNEQMQNSEIEKNTYYGYEWRMRLQPTLYELPEDFGSLKAGTLLCTGVSTTTATRANSDADYDGDLQTSIDIFYSVDGGRNWKYLAHAIDGGLSYSGSGEPIWEPYLIMDNGYIYCLYSDERNMRSEGQNVNGQRLTAVKINDNSDVVDIFDIVNMSSVESVGGTWARPGMPVAAKLADGSFVLVYENVKYGEPFGTYMKFADHIDDWKNDYETKGTFISAAGGGSPYVCVMPDGKIVLSSEAQTGVFVFDNKADAVAGEYTQLATGFGNSYTRSIYPLIDGERNVKLLMAKGGGYNYTVDSATGASKLETGVFELYEAYDQIKAK